MDELTFAAAVIDALAWPVILLALVVMFRGPLAAALLKVQELTFKGFGSEISTRLAQVQLTQEAQKQEIDALGWLLARYLPDAEVWHLQRLDLAEPYQFQSSQPFHEDLRHLRAVGFIKSEGAIGDLPEFGMRLQDHVSATPAGQYYLALRKRTLEKGDRLEGLLSGPERELLRQLAQPEPYPFSRSPRLQDSLRTLRRCNVIRTKLAIADLPELGDRLQDHVDVTHAGNAYLRRLEAPP